MKSKLLFTLLLVFIFSFAKAQDTIFKTDNTIIEAKVTDIGDAVIKYKKFSNPDGPLYNIEKTEVMMIVYQNGQKEIYNQTQTNQQVITPPTVPSQPATQPTAPQNNNIQASEPKPSAEPRVKNHILQGSVSLAYTFPKQDIGIGGFFRLNYTYKNNIVWGFGLGIFHKKFKNEDFAADISNWSLIVSPYIGYQIPLQKFRIIPAAGLFWGGVRQKATGEFDIPAAFAADIGYFGELKIGYAVGDATVIYLSGAYYNNFNDYNGHFFKATPLSAGILFKM